MKPKPQWDLNQEPMDCWCHATTAEPGSSSRSLIVQYVSVLDEPHCMLHCIHLASCPHSLSTLASVSFLQVTWNPYNLHPESTKKDYPSLNTVKLRYPEH